VRSFQLVRLALEAEGLRLRHHARRTLFRLVLGGFALLLVFGALAFGHVAAWYWLRESMAGQYAGLIFAGVDLLLAAILAGLAARATPGQVELEALEVRRRALDATGESLTAAALLIRLIDLVISAHSRK
jgi:hypothetical protein